MCIFHDLTSPFYFKYNIKPYQDTLQMSLFDDPVLQNDVPHGDKCGIPISTPVLHKCLIKFTSLRNRYSCIIFTVKDQDWCMNVFCKVYRRFIQIKLFLCVGITVKIDIKARRAWSYFIKFNQVGHSSAHQ